MTGSDECADVVDAVFGLPGLVVPVVARGVVLGAGTGGDRPMPGNDEVLHLCQPQSVRTPQRTSRRTPILNHSPGPVIRRTHISQAMR